MSRIHAKATTFTLITADGNEYDVTDENIKVVDPLGTCPACSAPYARSGGTGSIGLIFACGSHTDGNAGPLLARQSFDCAQAAYLMAEANLLSAAADLIYETEAGAR